VKIHQSMSRVSKTITPACRNTRTNSTNHSAMARSNKSRGRGLDPHDKRPPDEKPELRWGNVKKRAANLGHNRDPQLLPRSLYK
jgi:hypothetical protein